MRLSLLCKRALETKKKEKASQKEMRQYSCFFGENIDIEAASDIGIEETMLSIQME